MNHKCWILALAIMIFCMCMMQTVVDERFSYDTSAFVAPPEYDAYGITNPVYAP